MMTSWWRHRLQDPPPRPFLPDWSPVLIAAEWSHHLPPRAHPLEALSPLSVSPLTPPRIAPPVRRICSSESHPPAAVFRRFRPPRWVLAAYFASSLFSSPRGFLLTLPSISLLSRSEEKELDWSFIRRRRSVRFPSPFRDAELVVAVAIVSVVCSRPPSSPMLARKDAGATCSSATEPLPPSEPFSGDLPDLDPTADIRSSRAVASQAEP